ncbi:MAG: hypothetical protein J0L61_12415, partial [Planctomycetes bacterium]|nr:hypothetical protein [Planctomycetota bacterium]
LEPGAVPPAPEPAAPRDRVRTRFGATETAGLHRVPLHERAINVLGGLSVIALFTAKFFVLLPGRSGAGRPPVPAWYWMLLVAVAVLALLSYCLKFIRGRRASAWTIRGIESGICVESKRYAGRVIEVPADRCWVWVTRQPKVARFAPEQYTWVFSLPEHPHTLRCDGFDLRAKPWGAWLDEWRELAGAQPELEPD